jgi:acetamidase/formamidase
MPEHALPLNEQSLHDHYCSGISPVLTIASGDIVNYQTLDVDWTLEPQKDWDTPPARMPRPKGSLGDGPPLSGPIYVQDASPGDILEVQILEVRPKSWGWTKAGGRDFWPDLEFGADQDSPLLMNWSIDPDKGTAISLVGVSVSIRPFMGMMGVCPSDDGQHEAWSPTGFGGNLDCKELVAGTSLFLPVGVDGALFSTGDGHAVQGDGELCGCAIECPMERVRLKFNVHKAHPYPFIHARTLDSMTTFGFDRDLKVAMTEAGNRMIDFMIAEFNLASRAAALALCSCVVDFRITQVANPAFGVHAVLNLSDISLTNLST